MGEVQLASETSWQQKETNCITAPECLGWGWLLLLAPSRYGQVPTRQHTLNLAIRDLLSKSEHWQSHPHPLLPFIVPDQVWDILYQSQSAYV